MSALPDMLGAVIVERLLRHGADIWVTDAGDVRAYFPEPGIGRRPREPDLWMRGFTDGALCALWDIVTSIPSVQSAAVDHISQFPASRYAGSLIA